MGVCVVGLGMEGLEGLSKRAVDKLLHAENLILQTGDNAAAAQLAQKGIPFSTLDGLYEKAEDFDEFAVRAIAWIREGRDTVFGVIGDGLSLNRVVAGLMLKGDMEIIPAGQEAMACARMP